MDNLFSTHPDTGNRIGFPELIHKIHRGENLAQKPYDIYGFGPTPPGYSVTDLKTIEDWVLERRFKAVPGVVDVISWGGKTKTYDITIDLDRLLSYGLTLKQVLDGLNNANINVGANTVNIGQQSAIVRSVGQIRTMDDIRHTMITVRDGAPVLTVKETDFGG